MITAFVLLVLGLLFIFLEFYMPGLVMGTIGGILMLASMIVFGEQSRSFPEILLFVLLEFVLLFLLIKYTLKRIPKAKESYSIYLNDDQEGFQASEYDKNAIGKDGIAITDLKPGGFILVNGQKHQAISQTGYIVQGTEVKVIGGEAESLVVKQTNPNKDKSS